MPCSLHSLKVASCPECTAGYLLEKNILSLGPRSRRQFADLRAKFKAKRIPSDIQLYKHLFCHRLHRLALYISEHAVEATDVADLPAKPHIKALMTRATTDPFVLSKVQFVALKRVRAKTPLGMFDENTLEAGILRANIKGCKIISVAAEYAEACIDVAKLIALKKVFTDNITVWHADVVPEHSPAAMDAWDALLCTSKQTLSSKRKL